LSLRNPVIWQDGAFIRPGHFQQQARYHDYVARRQNDAMGAYNYGLEALEINRETLLHGRFALTLATGIFPDRTVFDLPAESPAPAPLDLSERTLTNEIVYLCLPVWASNIAEIPLEGVPNEAARFSVIAQDVRDTTSEDNEPWPIDVGQLRLSLRLHSDDRSHYSCIPLARILEKRSDGAIVLDENFMPMALTIEAVSLLRQTLDDFSGLLSQRASQIATRLGGLGQGGVADVADFMMLQTVNRWGAYFKHLSTIRRLHPERLFATFAAAAGELATFTHETRLPDSWPPYAHEEPHLAFIPLIASLRRSLSVMLEPNAIALTIHKHKFGILTAPLADRSLITSCVFVLAVRAAVPLERIAKTFPSQIKISSIEKIRELISLHLPGVTLQPMATAPRQLPYHAGYTYFLLDHNSAGWKNIVNSSGFAFHIAGEFPQLDMQFWAIRGRGDGRSGKVELAHE